MAVQAGFELDPDDPLTGELAVALVLAVRDEANELRQLEQSAPAAPAGWRWQGLLTVHAVAVAGGGQVWLLRSRLTLELE